MLVWKADKAARTQKNDLQICIPKISGPDHKTMDQFNFNFHRSTDACFIVSAPGPTLPNFDAGLFGVRPVNCHLTCIDVRDVVEIFLGLQAKVSGLQPNSTIIVLTGCPNQFLLISVPSIGPSVYQVGIDAPICVLKNVQLIFPAGLVW